MKASLLALAASTLLSFGCMASGQVHSSAHVTAPQLVYISSDVQVVSDYDEPIFYTSSYYWRYNGGVWYRSTYHTGGWTRISVVPVSIRRIESPTAYIHYRGAVRASADSRQEQRNDAKAEQKEQQAERKEAKQAEREERKEAKAEQRAEQKSEHEDAKAEHKADHKPGKK